MHDVKFKQVIDLGSEEVKDKIDMAYRLVYLKDTAMARFIDDQAVSIINNLVMNLHQSIIDHLFSEETETNIQSKLLQKMKDTQSVEVKEMALKFFMELCHMLKGLNCNQKMPF